jgi:hypothetical protein
MGNPAQSPDMAAKGKVEIQPSLGVMSGGDDWGDADSFLLECGVWYGVNDSLQLGGNLGGLMGDLNTFIFGAGTFYQIVHQNKATPINFTGFMKFDLAVGEFDNRWDTELTAITMLFGGLVSHRFPGKISIEPYGGIGMGFTFTDINNNSDTEMAFDIIFGLDVQITKTISLFTEFDIGPTDGLPILSWHFGAGFVL